MSTFDYSRISPSDAADLRQIAERLRYLLPRAASLIIEIGDQLKEAKIRLDHGEFCAFCLQEAKIPIRTAQNYLALAELAKVFPSEVANIPARTGYKLAAKGAPVDVVEAVMTEVREGRVPSFDEVQRRLGATKGTPAPSDTDLDDLADRMLDALDELDVSNVEKFLRTGTKVMIVAFCDRLQFGLAQRQTTPAALDVRPKNAQ